MKKLFLISIMLIFLGLVASKAYADPSWNNGGSMKNKPMEMMQHGGMWGMQKGSMMAMWKVKKDIATNCKYAMKIKAQMRKLRMQTIMSDPKLKRELNRIRALGMKLYKDTSAKLQKNPKYRNDEHWENLIHKKLRKDIMTEMKLQMQMVNRMMQGM